MISINVSTQVEEADFARAATEHFRENPQCFTYSKGDPTPGELFAIRWNCMAVLVVKLSDDHTPLIYAVHQFIGSDLPSLSPTFHS